MKRNAWHAHFRARFQKYLHGGGGYSGSEYADFF